MKRTPSPPSTHIAELRQPSVALWIAMATHAVAWIVASGFAYFFVNHETAIAIGFLGGLSILLIYLALRWSEKRRWIEPLRHLARELEDDKADAVADLDRITTPQIADVARSIRDFQARLRETVRQGVGDVRADRSSNESGEISALSFRHDPALTASEITTALHESEPVASDSAAADIIAKLDPTTLRWLASSPAEQYWLGLSFPALQHRCYLELVHPEDRRSAREQIRRAVAKRDAYGLSYRVRNARGEDREVSVDLSVRFNRDGSPRYIRIRTEDVTEKVKTDRELRRKTLELSDFNAHLTKMNRDLEDLSNSYADLYHNVPIMYFSLDRKCRITQCNETLVKTLGYSRETLMGRRFSGIVDLDQQEALRAWFETLKSAGKAEVSLQLMKQGGERIDVWLASTVITRPDGTFVSARNVARDETERLRLEAELRIKNQRLESAISELLAKNRELDEFTYVVSHDLQEPVRTLINFSDFLMEEHGAHLNDTGREYLQYIVDASRRLRALIKDLLILSRAGKIASDFSVVDLADAARVAISDLGARIQSQHATVMIDEQLPLVWADRDRVIQLLSNLISNGLKYNKSTSPTIRLSAVQVDPSLVAVSVRDNGIGIATENRNRIFDLFRQLHPRGEFEGTGAGLAICRKIVHAHGGTIRVDASNEGGSAFVFTLKSAPVTGNFRGSMKHENAPTATV